MSKVFVAGATGVIGHRAVKQLVDAGHDVTAIARSAEKAAYVRRLGATPAEVDLFAEVAVKQAVTGHDVVINLATHIPPLTRASLPGAWKENNRIRTEGSRILVDAALDAGAGRYIQEGIAFLYEDRGDQWIDEDVPMDAPDLGRSQFDAEANVARFTAGGGVGVMLRFGAFYAPDAGHTEAMIKMARRRVASTFGDQAGYTPMIHADDAAAAVVAALRAPAGVYNVVDDGLLTKAEMNEALAAALHKRKGHVVPKLMLKAGGSASDLYVRSQRVSNKRFKDATGWSPRYPTVREGWPAVVSEAENRAAGG